MNVECQHCGGHGMGPGGYCSNCSGRGYFTVDIDDPEWIENCEEHSLDPETGEEL